MHKGYDTITTLGTGFMLSSIVYLEYIFGKLKNKESGCKYRKSMLNTFILQQNAYLTKNKNKSENNNS